jgi:hypothetical protein
LRPTAVEPVKSRWSNGSEAKAWPTSTPPVITATSASSNLSATRRRSSSEKAGVSSEGFSIAQLPAASASTSGERASWSG